MLIEGENTLRLREAIKAAFPPERTAPIPYDFDEVNDPSNCVTYLFKAIFKRRSRYTNAAGHRTKSLPLKGRELRPLLQFLDHHPVGERLILRGIRRNGRRLVIISARQKVRKSQNECHLSSRVDEDRCEIGGATAQFRMNKRDF